MGRAAADRAVQTAQARARAISAARVAVGLAALGLVVGIAWAGFPWLAWLGVGALAAAFVGLVLAHAHAFRRKDRALAAMRFHERGLDRLAGRWTAFPSLGARFGGPDHPSAGDLDLFGHASLFQLLDTTETRFGEERLGGWLRDKPAGGWGELRARQEAVRDLSARVAFRERLSVLGATLGTTKPDPAPFLAWAEGSHELGFGRALGLTARLLPALVIVGFAFGRSIGLPRAVWLVGVAIELAILMAFRDRTGIVVGAVSSREGSLASYGELFHALEGERFEAPRLRELQGKLIASGAQATQEMARLARIVGFVDARQNEVFRLFIAPVLLWDLNCAIALEGWRRRAGTAVRGWFEALGEVEALASFAGFAFDRPDCSWPELMDAPLFEATGLGHPLLPPDKCVKNDLSLPGSGHALVVTGSNMSGKSTLLRAIGINAVLALAGAPVCAIRLRLGPVTVATSMRVVDSLEEGVSRFYAELRKLKAVVDAARLRPGVLFLLDEILHGTNSRERLIGARAVVRELLARGALGAVSTHDLGLTDLEKDAPGHVRNVHFEEQVAPDDTMSFDYRLKDGVVQSSNALRLMRIVGLDIVGGP